ncbi:Uncharacterised protein [Vibrio cholerae]|nr:Uncharacterised protein [Vibrio cholerae]
MHKTVFENGFSDHATAFRHHVQQCELRLHVGWKTWVRRSTYRNRFELTPCHIQTDPIFATLNLSPRFFKLS